MIILKKTDLDNVISDSFFNIIYNCKFKSMLKHSISNSKIIEKKHSNYINILYAIDNVPPCFNATRKYIKERVDEDVSFIDELDYYKNKDFYKTGFIDGYKFFLELQNQERNDKANE